MIPAEPYNPLDRKNLGISVGEALLAADIAPLGEVVEFDGAGIYAIYYTGEFPPYSAIAEKNRENVFGLPIYVGKAVPPGARKGRVGLNVAPKKALFRRLKEHADSIRTTADNLNIDDFFSRYLVVDDIWIPLGESLLIARFSPIWNTLIDGYGNHDPGSGRYDQERSRWDTLHPGRPWAAKCRERRETQEQIVKEIEEFLRT